jgi:hypothetical protein
MDVNYKCEPPIFFLLFFQVGMNDDDSIFVNVEKILYR